MKQETIFATCAVIAGLAVVGMAIVKLKSTKAEPKWEVITLDSQGWKNLTNPAWIDLAISHQQITLTQDCVFKFSNVHFGADARIYVWTTTNRYRFEGVEEFGDFQGKYMFRFYAAPVTNQAGQLVPQLFGHFTK